jgi:Flp pilus assembly protein TadG
MNRVNTRTLRHLVRSTRATELAETAIILPLFFMIFMGVFWFGQAFRIYGTLAHAARAGAEAAVAPVCTTCGAAAATAPQNAQTAVYTALAAAHLNKKQLVANAAWTPPLVCTCNSVTSSSACKSAAACDSSVADMCVQVNVQLSYPTGGAMGSCGTSVSARYQSSSHFRIPLTSMDLGNMLIPGQAQMRVETQ